MTEQEVNSTSDTIPIALGAKGLAKMLGVSLRHIRRMDSAGKLPKAVSIGRSKRWLVSEIQDWCQSSAPDRATWEQMKKQNRREKNAA